jgi:carbon monoxide dehydrogenase subunit G
VGFGATRVTFANDVEFVALDPPNHATLKAHGTAPGSAADVTSEMQLVAVSAETTELQWSADVVVLGTIASLAARLAYSNFRFD